MVKNDIGECGHSEQVRGQGPLLVNRPLIAYAGGHAQQANGHKIGIISVQRIAVMVAHNHCGQGMSLGIFVAQKGGKLNKVRILFQILVCIHREKPLAGRLVHHSVPGGGKVVDPGEVDEDISILFRNLPASIGRTSVRHDQLGGDSVPQGLEVFQTMFDTANIIFEDNANGQQRRFLFHIRFLLMPELWENRRWSSGFPIAPP